MLPPMDQSKKTMCPSKSPIAYDTETYPNYFCFVGVAKGGEVFRLECRGKEARLDDHEIYNLRELLCERITYSFNGCAFDNPVIWTALQGASACEICDEANRLIMDRRHCFRFKYEGLMDWQKKHIDLFGSSPRFISLKELACRMGYHKLENLPIPPNTEVTNEQADTLLAYCENDCLVTAKLANILTPLINLKIGIRDGGFETTFPNWCIPSKTAQAIAESHWAKVSNAKATRHKGSSNFAMVDWNHGDKTTKLSDSLTGYYMADGKGVVTPATAKTNLERIPSECFNIGGCDLKFGIGGLHSIEKPRIIEGSNLTEIDATSYYPHLVSGCSRLFGVDEPAFVVPYRDMMEKRLEAKKQGDVTESEMLKLMLNSTYGKLGSKYSPLFEPALRLGICLGGQILMFYLCELAEKAGLTVHSVDTDGVLVGGGSVDSIMNEWTDKTGIPLESSKILSRLALNVSNYFDVLPDGHIYGSGRFAIPEFNPSESLKHAPNFDIVPLAVVNHFTHQGLCHYDNHYEIRTTLEEYGPGGERYDPHMWVKVLKAKEGCIWLPNKAKDKPLPMGKVARFYKAEKQAGYMATQNKSGNYISIAEGEGVRPIADTEEGLLHLDYDFYLKEAEEIVNTLRCDQKDQ